MQHSHFLHGGQFVQKVFGGIVLGNGHDPHDLSSVWQHGIGNPNSPNTKARSAKYQAVEMFDSADSMSTERVICVLQDPYLEGTYLYIYMYILQTYILHELSYPTWLSTRTTKLAEALSAIFAWSNPT